MGAGQADMKSRWRALGNSEKKRCGRSRFSVVSQAAIRARINIISMIREGDPMTSLLECNDLFSEVDDLLASDALDAAMLRLEEIHVAHHADAWAHMGVHAYFMRIAWRRRRWLRVVVEMLAIPFVAPTSLAQRDLGLALPSRKPGGDSDRG